MKKSPVRQNAKPGVKNLRYSPLTWKPHQRMEAFASSSVGSSVGADSPRAAAASGSYVQPRMK